MLFQSALKNICSCQQCTGILFLYIFACTWHFLINFFSSLLNHHFTNYDWLFFFFLWWLAVCFHEPVRRKSSGLRHAVVEMGNTGGSILALQWAKPSTHICTAFPQSPSPPHSIILNSLQLSFYVQTFLGFPPLFYSDILLEWLLFPT